LLIIEGFKTIDAIARCANHGIFHALIVLNTRFPNTVCRRAGEIEQWVARLNANVGLITQDDAN
jgi:hypothetical protein